MSLFGTLIQQSIEAKPEKPRSRGRYEHTKSLNAKQTSDARERYKAALFEWTPTQVLEARLGYVYSACNSFLRKLYAEGLVERRPRGNTKKYNRLAGYEWRWKDEAS